MTAKRNLVLGALLVLGCTVQVACAANNLSRAAIAGDLQQVQAAVKAGEGINDIDKCGWTALHWAVYYDQPQVALWLLESGANPNIKTEYDYGNYQAGTTPLILAAAYGHDQMVAALLKKKADPGVIDKKGKKAIDYAREYDFNKCVTLLEGK